MSLFGKKEKEIYWVEKHYIKDRNDTIITANQKEGVIKIPPSATSKLIVIGRSNECDIVTSMAAPILISRKHVQLNIQTNGRATITNMGRKEIFVYEGSSRRRHTKEPRESADLVTPFVIQIGPDEGTHIKVRFSLD
ncbi:FHA domain-containing protein [archaeon]|jgi:hypothetical protein|nr:FHA domain-containing protein [archaeon]MBT6762113.1 FHA domain-containing protein [archaeon]